MTSRSLTAWLAAGLLAGSVALFVTLVPGPRDQRAASDEGSVAPLPVGDETVAVAPAAAMPGSEAPSTTIQTPFAESPAPSASPAGAPVSPLTRSPGYYPPADPESTSVRLGRRQAPVIPDAFEGGAASLEEFGRLVVAALSALDAQRLHSLRVTYSEFERILWREFPESRPVTNIQAADAWSLSDPRSRTAVNRATGIYGGRRLRFLTVEVGRTQTFTNFRLHRDVTILAVDEATARLERIQIAPSVAERKGRFKALLYRE